VKQSAVGYIRVSTFEQASEGVSIDAQRKSIQRYCDLHDFELVEIYIDPGVSASKPLFERPEGARMQQMLDTDPPAKLVALKLDRLFRNAQDCLSTVDYLRSRGIALASVREQIDTSSAMGRFFLTIMAAMAEMELATIRERTQYAMDHLKAEGKRAGTIPYGYKLDIDGESLVECKEERRVIDRILEMRADGMSYRAITDWLNAKGIHPKRGKWHHSVLWELVQRELKGAQNG
jgi:DNA invertase Pin-like site-specific DNA recombinase